MARDRSSSPSPRSACSPPRIWIGFARPTRARASPKDSGKPRKSFGPPGAPGLVRTRGFGLDTAREARPGEPGPQSVGGMGGARSPPSLRRFGLLDGRGPAVVLPPDELLVQGHALLA